MALDEIVADKIRSVAERICSRPLATFRDALEPSDRSLAAALRQPRTGFIMEHKRASPSRGRIHDGRAPETVAASYAPFADAISVLTDAPYFAGSFAHLAAIRAAVGVPVLCKDFIVDPYQLYEARSHGADAVLLMCSVLDDELLRECLGVANELELDALVEVHDEHELTQALLAGADIVGINNRNLHTLEVDLEVSRALLPRVPPEVVSVCESGIRDHADVRGLRAGADAFLVGTTLMASEDLDAAVRSLVFGEVKICGLTRPEDALAAWQAGATYGGFVHWPRSPRHLEDYQPVIAAAPLRWVGVFVDAPIDQVIAVARSGRLFAVQLHGEEDYAYTTALRDQLTDEQLGVQIWKAQRVGDDLPLLRKDVDRVLLDTYVPGKPGGTGKRFDWSRLAALPERDKRRIVLSGGITPEVADRAAAVGCAALDLSSGVESAPGQKDGARLEALFAALRGRRDAARAGEERRS